MVDRLARLDLHARGRSVGELHTALDKLGLEVPPAEVTSATYGLGTRQAILRLQGYYRLQPTGRLDAPTAAALAAGLTHVRHDGQLIEGRIYLDNGLPAPGLTLRLYARGFGETARRLAETKTDAHGFYAFAVARADPLHVEVRVPGAQSEETALCERRRIVSAREVINLVVPRRLAATRAEFARLSDDVQARLGDGQSLARADEQEGQRDLTWLHEVTGWDARLIALAAQAARIAARTKIPAEAAYGLLRSGLPANPAQLLRVPPGTVDRALRAAVDAGVIALDNEGLTRARTAFRNAARAQLARGRAPGALSTTAELLAAAPLDDAQRAVFLDAHVDHRGAALRDALANEGFTAPKIDAIAAQGRLAFLTGNNAPLVARLQAQPGLAQDEGLLADHGYHRAETWRAELDAIAAQDGTPLDQLVPPRYTGADASARADAYAADLARKVRLAFPTRVLRQRVAREELPLGGGPAARDALTRVLANAEGQSFVVGHTPLGTFVRDHQAALLHDVPQADRARAIADLKRVQRLYQITPSDDALDALVAAGFTSAQDVVALSWPQFEARVGGRINHRGELELTYRKAQQVSVVVSNFFTGARQIESTPDLFACSPSPAARTAAQDALTQHYPTLEGLFGSLDYCACDHCRSVLSPAAYLVDLLSFIDPRGSAWTSFTDDWRTRHAGQDYLLEHRQAYEVLIARRPDLPQLALTCENTNTALPYIDLVNEILEYTVAHGDLAPGAAGDTGAATTAELLAEPARLIPTAYDRLAQARYPLDLPFDLWLETVRAFARSFDAPLWTLLDALRPTDALQAGAGQAYGRAEIFQEYLGLSGAERRIFTHAQPLDDWQLLYGFDDPAQLPAHNQNDALVALKSAKTLARTLGLDYDTLKRVVRTAFVNPRLESLVLLRRIDLDVADVLRYVGAPAYPALSADERAALEVRLDAVTANYPGFDARQWLADSWAAGDWSDILVLFDPSGGCTFDETILRYADGSDADARVYHQINVFVRLRRRLGWTIEELDRALAALTPRGLLPRTAANLGAGLDTALLYFAHLEALVSQLALGKGGRERILTLWSDIPTTGERPLYQQLFLSPNILQIDPVFDHPLGQYLTDPNRPLAPHLVAVQAALGLTADEIERIVGPIEAARLTLPTLSTLHRWAVLARGLRLTVRQLSTLILLSGIDPFAALIPGAVAVIDEDRPWSNTLRFVELVGRIRAAGVDGETLDRWLLHRDTDAALERGFIQAWPALSADLRRILAETSALVEPTDAQITDALALLWPPDAVQEFLGLWTGQGWREVRRDGVAEADGVVLDAGDARATYDRARHIQRVATRGLLTAARTAQLNASPLVVAMLGELRADAQRFFDKYLLRGAATPSAGFADAGDFELFFTPIADDRPRRRRLGALLIPLLQRLRARARVEASLAASVGGEPGLIDALTARVEDAAHAGARAVSSIAACELGLTATFFATNDRTGNPLRVVTTPRADLAARPPNTQSARLDAYIEVPSTGAYRFFVTSDVAQVGVRLTIGDDAATIIAGPSGAEVSAFVELTAGVLHRCTLELDAVAGATVTLDVLGERLPRAGLEQLVIHPAAQVERARRAWTILAKGHEALTRLGLPPVSAAYLLDHRDDFGGLDFGAWPTQRGEASAAAQIEGLLRAAAWDAPRRELGASADEWVALFVAARRTFADPAQDALRRGEVQADIERRYGLLLRRDPALVRRAMATLGQRAQSAVVAGRLDVTVPDVIDARGVARLMRVLQLIDRLGVSPEDLAAWARPAPDFAAARAVRDALKARYQPEAWQRFVRSVSDALRKKRRDALVAYVLHEKGLERVEDLYDHFLIDPGTEPVVQTSRLRLAISSVQLFIQRCFLNLENEVHPSALDSHQWEWMKRYRVWEANRKIFLQPENWLEPELRDDKSHLFRAMEETLFAGDISPQLVDDAFFAYLKGLDGIARLEIVSVYLQEDPLGPEGNRVHVIGRAHAEPRTYYYRSYQHRMWTPWEPIDADVQGDHVVAVFWQDRLHIFWATFLDRTRDLAGAGAPTDQLTSMDYASVAAAARTGAVERRVEIQVSWAEYFQGAWTGREASGFGRGLEVVVSPNFSPATVFMYAALEYDGEGEVAAVRVLFDQPIALGLRFVSKNASPRVVGSPTLEPPPYSVTGVTATQRRGSGPLSVSLIVKSETIGDGPTTDDRGTLNILDQGDDYRLAMSSTPLRYLEALVTPDSARQQLLAPFFYQDDRNTLFVEPTLTETTFTKWTDWGIEIPPQLVTPEEPWPQGPWERPPYKVFPPVPGWIDPVDLAARFEIAARGDWVADDTRVVRFGDVLIGAEGGVGIMSEGTFDASGGPASAGAIPVRGGGLADAKALGRTGEHLAAGMVVRVLGEGRAVDADRGRGAPPDLPILR